MKQIKLTLSEQNATHFKFLSNQLDVSYDALIRMMIYELVHSNTYKTFLELKKMR